MVRRPPYRSTALGDADLAQLRLALGRARVAVARDRYTEASELLAPLVASAEPGISARAKIQLALAHHGSGEVSDSSRLLGEVNNWVDRERVQFEEAEGVETAGRGPGRAKLSTSKREHLELFLELARAWTWIDGHDEARQAYSLLTKDVALRRSHDPEAHRILALAEYRLAELVVDDDAVQAYSRWRTALELRDEEISPYAALRMANDIGGKLLLNERIEKLFKVALLSPDLPLRSEAALGLARHLKERHQFGESRRYLKLALEIAADPDHEEQARRELESLGPHERMVRNRELIMRPLQLRAMVDNRKSRSDPIKKVIIVGAGTGGSYLFDSLDKERYEVCGFVDDSAHDVAEHPNQRILGRIDDLVRIICDHRPDEVLLAIPTLAGARRRDVVTACRETHTHLLNLPRMHELGIGWTKGDSRSRLMNQLRVVEVEETIGDERVEIDEEAPAWLRYETAIVIGAGALGAEICRRLVDGEIGRLVVVDRREAALKKIEGDLADTREFEEFIPWVRDASDLKSLARAFGKHTPFAVFSTTGEATALALEPERLAADPDGWRTIFANELGVTLAASRAAAEEGVPRLIHVSSPRAADPTDSFGAMKALCERLALFTAARNPSQVQAVVRVGPILDSKNGRFSRMKRQIKAGSIVQVPGPGSRARFVSLARWAELVLHSARLAKNCDLMELSSGTEIGIRDVAEVAIRIRDLFPEDLRIKETEGESWDERLPDGKGEVRGDEALGIRAQEMTAIDEESVQLAVEHCATLIARDAASQVGAESYIRDRIEGMTEVS
jgi:FlaA1/EpsC-like NDP-sugar epimerase